MREGGKEGGREGRREGLCIGEWSKWDSCEQGERYLFLIILCCFFHVLISSSVFR